MDKTRTATEIIEQDYLPLEQTIVNQFRNEGTSDEEILCFYRIYALGVKRPQVQVLSLGPDKAVLSLERAAFLQFIWRFQNPENCIWCLFGAYKAKTRAFPY